MDQQCITVRFIGPNLIEIKDIPLSVQFECIGFLFRDHILPILRGRRNWATLFKVGNFVPQPINTLADICRLGIKSDGKLYVSYKLRALLRRRRS